MSILDYFDDDKVSVFIIPIVSAPDSSGTWVKTEGEPVPALAVIYSSSQAAQYFGQAIDENIAAVLLMDTPLDITSRVLVDGDKYEIESMENIAYQEDVYMIGLRDHR